MPKFFGGYRELILSCLFGDIVFSMDFDFSECFVDHDLKVRRYTHLLVNIQVQYHSKVISVSFTS